MVNSECAPVFDESAGSISQHVARETAASKMHVHGNKCHLVAVFQEISECSRCVQRKCVENVLMDCEKWRAVSLRDR